jgi:hypothetical protein
MLTYTTLKIDASDSKKREAADEAAALAVVEGIDWSAVMNAWLETQEAPLPAVVFASRGSKATLNVSTLPHGNGTTYLQVLFTWDEKLGWIRSRRHVVSAELHDPAVLARCLGDLAAHRLEALMQRLHAEGVGVLD